VARWFHSTGRAAPTVDPADTPAHCETGWKRASA
jgi:hypothetical protein